MTPYVRLKGGAGELGRKMVFSGRHLARDATLGFRRIPTHHLIGLVAFIIAGTALRASLLTRSIHYDEAWTFLHYARRPLQVGLSTYTAPNNHLFNTLLVHLSTLAFGNESWVLRLPAFVSGGLLIPATYLLARMLFRDHAAAVAAAALSAFSVPLIEMSVNGRGYSLFALFATVSFSLGAYLIREQNLTAWWVLSASCILGFYSIPVMLYPFVTILLWMTLVTTRTVVEKPWSRLRALFLFSATVATGTAILYLPVLRQAGIKAITNNRFVAPKPWHEFVQSSIRLLANTGCL